MLCRKPIPLSKFPDYYLSSKNPSDWSKGLTVPCGQCLMCRINKRRQWSLRLFLEGTCHEYNSFWTFTFNDENIPLSRNGEATLDYSIFQRYLKRLRKALGFSFRYYVAGEYGSVGSRPHFHCVLFGVPSSCYKVVSGCWTSTSSNTISHCYQCITKHVANPLSEITSSLGNVYVGYDCSLEALQYVAGYVLKKVTSSGGRLPRSDPNYRTHYIDGRVREFQKMSRLPGIGVPALLSISKQLKDKARLDGQFPTSINVCGKSLPFDRTLLGYLSYLFPEYFDSFLSVFKAKAEYDNLIANPSLLNGISDNLITHLGKLGAYRFSKDSQKALNIEARMRLKGVFSREA